MIANALLTPNVGLIFWTILSFTLLLLVLRRFAWKPILKGLKDRETSIQTQLDEAKMAREEVKALKSQNEDLLQQARLERDAMLKEAREMKDKIVSEASTLAKEESARLLAIAKDSIEKEKLSALRDLKQEVVRLSMEAASMILKKELDNPKAQEELVNKYIADVHTN